MKVQDEADRVTDWFDRNDMLVSSDKTKLLIIATGAKRSAKLTPTNFIFNVAVDGLMKEETKSEKLLGITVNNKLNWKNHLYGDEDNTGLLKQLSQRIGMLRKMRNFVTSAIFKTVLNGIFNNKLIYGITVYGGVWGLPGILNDDPVNSTSFTKEDMRKLQVMQNVAIKHFLCKPRDTPVTVLLSESKQLSVH